ncbi:Na(+) H(+) antiporter subunit D [Caenispirillum salinarum AK4]|uniref:Na(+) H(+) antiporter subunit D n=1 Tax=Caenispirillum salinarum AK4 TaxID=1238182 RepID=K9GXR5_9PROT|nr:proton-conducting transporter membrane subunit [Caenispirillum salinarum]EKV29564.1 Na(+) H(+) antiporter subunit D [Caenispirillum salinarum AK4]
MTSWLPALPVPLSLAIAIACFALRTHPVPHRMVSLAGGAGLLALTTLLLARVWEGAVLVAPLGDWAPPLGIAVVADPLSATFSVTAAVVALACIASAIGEADRGRERGGFHAFLHVVMAGCYGAFLTGDVFNLYVWFEVVLIASFALLVLGGEGRQLDGGIKYFVLNLIGTSVLLVGVALLYGLTGTLAMADLAGAVPVVENQALVTAVAMLFLFAFAVKGGLVPVFFWLPASYHAPPATVSALFAALLTKVGLYAALRVFTVVFGGTDDLGFLQTLILMLSGATLVIGVLGSLVERDARRILSFQVVGHMGYIAMGLGLMTPLGLAGAVFYSVHDMVVKAALFLTVGLTARLAQGSFALASGGGLMQARPGMALLLFLPAFSLAGIPPLSGFWGKYALVRAGLEAEQWVMAGVALLAAFLTVFAMARLWSALAWEDPPRPLATLTEAPCHPGWLAAPAVAMAGLVVILGLGAEPVLAVAERAAALLLDPEPYVEAVMGLEQQGGEP